MPTPVPAVPGDTLCNIAMRFGFLDCAPIRNDPANAGADFLNRDLRLGDIIVVPDRAIGVEGAPTEAETIFRLLAAPAIRIRFVHGSPDRSFLDDDTLTFLNVSNFRADRAGNTGASNPFSAAFGFNANAHADLDAFKIEVCDPGAPASINSELDALRPTLDPVGAVIGHERYPVPDDQDHNIPAELRRVTGGSCFRSQYLRLVTDRADFNSNLLQMLMLSDAADGLNTNNDLIRILDHVVQASYERTNCPAPAGQQKCTVRVRVPVGPRRQRLRIAVHCFNAAPGGAPVGGIAEADIRRRIIRHFGGIYAQAEISPKIDSVTFIDPPADDMIVVSPNTGRRAAGGSTITFTLSQPPPAGPSAADVTVTVIIPPTPGGLSPRQVADLIAAQVGALPGFSAAAFSTARAAGAPHSAADVIVTRADAARIAILNESTTDVGLTATGVVVSRVNVAAIPSAPNAATHIPHTHQYRRCLRAAPGDGTKLNAYIIGAFVSPTLLGQSLLWGRDLAGPTALPDGTVVEGFRGEPPNKFAFLIRATFNAVTVMGAANDFFNVFAHESMHTLADVNHLTESAARSGSELMFGNAAQQNNAPSSPKRIADTPLFLRCDFWDPARPNTPTIVAARLGVAGKAPETLVERLRDRASPLLED